MKECTECQSFFRKLFQPLRIPFFLDSVGSIKETGRVLCSEVNSPNMGLSPPCLKAGEAKVAFHLLGQLFWKTGKLSEVGEELKDKCLTLGPEVMFGKYGH